MKKRNVVLYVLIAFLLGLVTMFIIKDKVINNTEENVKKITTTTLEEQSDLKKGINNIYDSVVYIEVSGSRGVIASGSGFIYKEGYILTNYHVIENGTSYKIIMSDNTEVDAEYVNGDEYYDVAVLKIDNKYKNIATLGDSSSIELGDTVFTVGAPLGKEYKGTITKGIVSGTNRMVSVELSSGTYLMEVIQTDASINSGNSGGPICNINGDVIGITSSKLKGTGVEGMGFAIPINLVKELLDDMENGKKIERPYLGIQLADLNNTFALQYYYNIKIAKDVTFGAVLSYVENGKSASKAGLQSGDVIVEMDGEKIEDTSHFRYQLYKHKIGDNVKVKYYRNNKLLETTIELNEAIK